MIIGDIRFIEITTLSSRLCVLTGGAFLVVFRSRLTAAFFFFILTVLRSRFVPLTSKGKKGKQKSSKRKEKCAFKYIEA